MVQYSVQLNILLLDGALLVWLKEKKSTAMSPFRNHDPVNRHDPQTLQQFIVETFLFLVK